MIDARAAGADAPTGLVRRAADAMLLRIAAFTAAAAALMFTVKDGRVLAEAGLVGSCSAVTAPAGDAAAWQACRAGRLEGRPDLSRRSCTTRGVVGEHEFWRCPAPVDAGHLLLASTGG